MLIAEMTVGPVLGLLLAAVLFLIWMTTRFIPNDRIGIVEKFWSSGGSLTEGAVIALHGEAGYQADILRGGLHFGLWRWQYRVHKMPLITIKQGRIGYVFSRGGEQLMPSQTLAKIIDCNNFQDARKFLAHGGQKGRQRGILREGVYAINSRCSTSSPRTASSRWSGPRAWRSGSINCGNWTASALSRSAATPTRSASSPCTRVPRCRPAN